MSSTNGMVSEDQPWIDEYVKYLVERYFGQCGLQEYAFEELKGLPSTLSQKFGREPQYWVNCLADMKKAARHPNLVSAAVKQAGERVLYLSKKTGEPLCKYLEMALNGKWMSKWIVGYIQGMVELN